MLEGIVVDFTNNSTGKYVSYLWDLGFDNYLVMRHGGGIVGKKSNVAATEKNDANTNVHNDDEQKGTNTSAVSDKNKQQQQQIYLQQLD